MGITITNKGMQTTVQDQGRIGVQRYGFSESGVMDQYSYRMANLLVGNDKNEAVLEMTLFGSSFLFTQSNIVAITGADCDPKLNGKSVSMYQAFFVKEGDELTTGRMKKEAFSYVSFAGGLQLPKVMGSWSTSTRYGVGGFNGRALQEDDCIDFKSPEEEQRDIQPLIQQNNLSDEKNEPVSIRILLRPKSEIFPKDVIRTFLESTYIISNKSDRMGYRLNGPKVDTVNQNQTISEGTLLGDIQVPSEGQPIVLLADRQTTGGYPVIGTVCTVDIPKIVQCTSGQAVHFSQLTLKEAHALLEQQEAYFDKLENELNVSKQQMVKSKESNTVNHTGNTDDWNPEQLRQLVKTVNESTLTSFSYQDDNIKINLDKRHMKKIEVQQSTKSELSKNPTTDNTSTSTIISTLVGIFYNKANALSSPFVEEGTRVQAGQVVGIIEAMNNQYEIKAEKTGLVETVLVSHGQMVEYGQPIIEVTIEEEE